MGSTVAAHDRDGRGCPGRALVERRSSLLPAGVTAVQGEFVAGDPVELCDPAGRAVARGLVAYDAVELPALLGRSTRELGLREVVHRDDLVLLSPRELRDPPDAGTRPSGDR